MGEDQSPTRRRVTVAEAARILGVSVEAVWGRIKRGTLEHERTPEGLFVLLDADQSTDRTQPGTDRTTDQPPYEHDALIFAKDETIAALREQLESERQAHAEARRLLLEALTKIPPAIEAPREPSGATEAQESTLAERRAEKRRAEKRRAEAPAEAPDADRGPEAAADQCQAARERRRWTDTTDTGGGREEASERPWWRRVFGGG